MRSLYSTVLYLLTPFVLLRLLWSGFNNHDYWLRWNERFGFVDIPSGSRPRIWIHAVSVGEVQAAIPLVNRLLSDYPEYQILLTTVTPTGSEMVRQKFGDEVVHTFLPYDLPDVINRYLNRIQPLLLIVMETEIWPNLYHQCYQRGINILLANGRLSENSYKAYKKISRFTSQVLANINMITTQTEDDAERLISLGADPGRVIVMGNLKFDVSLPDNIVEQAQLIKRFFSTGRPIWIAASTHAGEEKIILNAHQEIIKRYPDCLLILAPRHPERFVKVANLSMKNGFNTINKSQAKSCTRETQVFLLDSIGELMVYYAVADVALVGGSLLPAYGGHNVLEPASLGVPVISGEFVRNFKEINDLLCDNGAEIQITDNEQLAEKVMLLFSDEGLRQQMGRSGRDIIKRNQGSIGRLMKLVDDMLIVEKTSVASLMNNLSNSNEE